MRMLDISPAREGEARRESRPEATLSIPAQLARVFASCGQTGPLQCPEQGTQIPNPESRLLPLAGSLWHGKVILGMGSMHRNIL